MNIEQAKQIDLQRLSEHLGGRYHRQTKADEIWFYSPFRPDERTASFKINPQRNVWYDFAIGAGGSTLDLWLDYYNQDRKSRPAIQAALQGLAQFSNQPNTLITQYRTTANDCNKSEKGASVQANRFKLIKPPGHIWHDALLQEISRRQLSLFTVAQFVRQANILDTKTGNKLTGFAFQNDAFGWEISIPNPKAGKSFKTSIGKKAPSSFTNDAHETALIFEGFWDYLTWVQMQKTSNLNADVYVMNTLSFKQQVTRSINEKYLKMVLLFLDNDESGREAENFFFYEIKEKKLAIGTKNWIYSEYKDLSDFWMSLRL